MMIASSWLKPKYERDILVENKNHKVSNVVVGGQAFKGTGNPTLIARFMEPTLGPSGANRTQLGPMLAPMNFAIWVTMQLK